MRTLIRAVVVAAALVFAMPALPVLAQGSSQASRSARASWTHIAYQSLPAKVASSQRRLFPHTRVTKAERAGTGKSATYRLTMAGKNKKVKFDAAGKILK